MSGSISSKELLAEARRGEFPSDSVIREFGENSPAEFFRDVVEPLNDSFDPTQIAAYERFMRVWISPIPAVVPVIPERVETVYVLSRVTLGADIKIVSPILAAMTERFPQARIVLVANRKSAELFEADLRIEHLNADYPRSGPVTGRIEFAHELKARLAGEDAIVIDPDSRMTQLGLIPVCAPERYFHFPSRIAGDDPDNLTDLVRLWLRMTFGIDGSAYMAPQLEDIAGSGLCAAVSLGVGENESKRIGGSFETDLIETLGLRYDTVWVDRGVGGEEARRVTAAVEESAVKDHVRYWEGGFAGFASIISQSDFYAGYDSAGQHAAAAAGVPLVSVFAGATSIKFRHRWEAAGHPKIVTISADGLTGAEVLNEFIAAMPLE